MNEKKKFGADTIVLFLARFLNFFLVFLVSLILIRRLGPENYGIWSFIISVVILASTIGSLGLNIVISKFLPFYFGKKDFGKAKYIFLQSLKLIIASSIVLSIAVYFLSSFLPYSDKIILLLPYFIFTTIYSLTSGTLFAIRKIIHFSALEISLLLAQLILLLYFSSNILTVSNTIFAFDLSSAIITSLSFVLLLKMLLLKYKTEKTKEKLSSLFFTSLPYNLSVMLNVLSEKTPIFILTSLVFLYSIKEVGFFSFAISLTTIVATLITSLPDNAMPLLVELSGTKERRKISGILIALTRYSYIATLPLVFILIFGSETIITFFFGKNYLPSVLDTMILSIILIPIVLRKLIAPLVLMKNKISLFFNFELLRFLISLPLIYLLSTAVGGIGASIGFTASLFVAYLFFAYKISKSLLKQMIRKIIKYSAISSIFILLYFIQKNIIWLTGSIMGLGILYFTILYFTKDFTKEDWKNILLIFKRE